MEMIKNQKFIFLYALILTLVVFNLGVFMGYMLEASRTNKINRMYIEAEMEVLDQRIQNDASAVVNFSCGDLVQENINFGDKIFNEALQIKRYEDANRINEDIIFQHKRFDLLRTLFWVNSIKIKKKCNSVFHTIVYIYKYNNPSVAQISEQKFFSNLLSELKEKWGHNIMLIPIAGDNDLISLDLLMKEYGVAELPTILIDEKFKITEVNNIEDIEKYF